MREERYLVSYYNIFRCLFFHSKGGTLAGSIISACEKDAQWEQALHLFRGLESYRSTGGWGLGFGIYRILMPGLGFTV